jgi:galactokinase
MDLPGVVKRKFLDLYGNQPILVRAPGRINLIGEHTDYNDGFVMPAAIDKEIIFAIAPAASKTSVITSTSFDERIEIDLDHIVKIKSPAWANYLLGVLFQLRERGIHLQNFNCIFGGNIPMGAGLSSSAALETGFAVALKQINNLELSDIDVIKIGQWSEHNFVGVNCGIMDQFASVMGREGHYNYLPLRLNGHAIVLCDSRVKHSLVDSEYNIRRSECEQGITLLKQSYPEVKSLRDISVQMLLQHQSAFPGKVYNRCLYVVQEIARVREASEYLKTGELLSFGKKMFETHWGLSDLYEVSCEELDFLVEFASSQDGVVGSRMMGGGFGGCTINIVRENAVEAFVRDAKRVYLENFSIELQSHQVNVTSGTSIISSTGQLIK